MRGNVPLPRILGRYVRVEGVLDLSQAIRKATGQAAEIFSLTERGYLRLGAWADIVIFDPERIKDLADYDQPLATPLGIDYVIVNGTVAVDHGNLTGGGPAGAVVRRREQ